VVLKGLKIPELAILELERIQAEAKRQLASERNVKDYDKIFPIFANNSMVMSVAILDFVDEWDRAKASLNPSALKKRRDAIIKLMKSVRRRGWLSQDVRGFNLD